MQNAQDVASKIENAFDSLNTLLGDNSIKAASSQGKKMMSQQKNLLKTLDSMGPNIKNANVFFYLMSKRFTDNYSEQNIFIILQFKGTDFF